MPISVGSKLGPYEIVAQAGAGGMGEVYRARDTRLNRDVAIKVLPQHLSSEGKYRERFEREARAISSLKHPNICTLYDVGQQDGVDYLVLEYLEGESLAQRMVRGAVPMQQVLAYGIQIADALERAHKQGVVHRDLKPGNVMITKDGVKLLDFGLAKPMAGAGLASSALGAMTASQESKPLTAEGTIVGTFQYMAPEQLEGKDADPRSDLFAFGCVLYEMAVGKRPFDGMTQASVVASILATEPPSIGSLMPMTPPSFERLVKTCMAKNPDERWQTAHDVKLQLKWIAEGGSQAGVAAPVAAHRKHREWTAWGVAAAFLLLALAAGTAYWRLVTAPQQVIRSTILSPEKAAFSLMGYNGAPMLSPDGTQLAFVGMKDGVRSIWLRPLSSSEAKPLPGTEGSRAPFWSPDSRYLAFFAGGKLKKIAVAGGTPEVVCDVDDARGGSWGSKDIIVFAASRLSPIFSVPAAGGKLVQVTELGEDRSHRWPHFLPDGEHFLFVSSPTGSATNVNNVRMGSLSSKSTKLVVASSFNAEYAQGYLFFVREGTLNAQPFDFKRGELQGEPTPVAPDIQVDALFSHALFSTSEKGAMVYQPGAVSNKAELIWYDRKGKQLGTVGEAGVYIETSISPDESKVAFADLNNAGTTDIWIYELARGIRTRFTTSGTNNRSPVWSPDGSALIYGSNRNSTAMSVYRQPVNTGGAPELLYQPNGPDVWVTDWSPDGQYATFSTASARWTIWILPLNGDHKPYAFMPSEFNQRSARFSPDSHWIAYASDESGSNQVYVAAFPAGGRKWQVSNAGGTQPVWSRNGKELYYVAPDNTLMAASVMVAGNELKLGVPEALFAEHQRNFDAGMYDVTRDGRFLVSSGPNESAAPLTLISNWPALVKK